jgi:hypothetical protein
LWKGKAIYFETQPRTSIVFGSEYLQGMEDCGFSIVPCARASPELIAAAKAEFQTALQASYKESSELSCVAIKAFGPNCRALFNHEVEVCPFGFDCCYAKPY